MRDIYRAVQESEADYPWRKFTPDGHLVGSVGKVIAAEVLDPELYGGMIVLSASDLTGHLHCRHLTALDLEVAKGARPEAQGLGPSTGIARRAWRVARSRLRRPPPRRRFDKSLM